MAKVVIELEGSCLRKAEVWAAYMALMAAVRGGPLEAPVSEAPVEAVAPAPTVAEMGPALTVTDDLPEPARKPRRTAKHPYGKATPAPEDRRPMYEEVAPKAEEPPAEEAAEAILEQPSKEDFKQRMHDGFYLKHGAAALVNLLQVNVGVKRLVDVPEDRRNDVLRLAGII